MTSKHTPGQWAIEFDDDLAVITASTRNGMVPIASVEVGFVGSVEAEQQANARLIAAAPDLEAALESMVREYDAWSGFNDDGFEPETIAKARAALSKSRGEN